VAFSLLVEAHRTTRVRFASLIAAALPGEVFAHPPATQGDKWLRLRFVGQLGQSCTRRFGGGAVRVVTENFFVQFPGVGLIGLAFFELGRLKQLRSLVGTTGGQDQEETRDHPGSDSLHAVVLSADVSRNVVMG
jgi:hypothetical protein